MRSKLIEIGCPAQKIQIQRIAIPLDKLSFRKRLPKNDGGKVIFIFCGRFVEKKGLFYVLEALFEVKKSYKNFEFRIIGDGPLKGQIEELIEKYDLSHHVRLLGFLTYQQYLAHMEEADIFIHPSVTSATGDSEGGAPTVILEAQAMGLPVISTTHADIPNIVRPQQSALLSKERDINGLVANIVYGLENQDRWADMGEAGRGFVEEFHDIKKEVNELEKKYREMICV
jgi:colanic acid/amylovoran biosynthesis glycosyltransferase